MEFQVINGSIQNSKYSRTTIYPMVVLNDMHYYMATPQAKDVLRKTGHRKISPEITATSYRYDTPIRLKIVYIKTAFGKKTSYQETMLRLSVNQIPDLYITLKYGDLEVFKGYATVEENPVFTLQKVETGYLQQKRRLLK